MTKTTKILLIIGSFLTILGLGIFLVAFSGAGWNFENLSTAKFLENQHEITQEFDKISIDINTADIDFEITDNTTAKVVCFERENQAHDVSVVDGVLTVKYNQDPWYKTISIFSFKTTKITVYLPLKTYNELILIADTADVRITKEFTFNNLSITTSTGDITLNNITADDVNLSVSTGDINLNNINCQNDLKIDVDTGDSKLNNVSCGNFISSGNTGDLELSNVIASGKFTITRDTGDVDIESCDANEILIVTDTGDVSMTLLSPKIFVVETDAGRKRVPVSTSGGLCQVTTDTGDIEILIKE